MEVDGWHSDPFGVHEERLFRDGEPTPLVRDGGIGSYHEPTASRARAVEVSLEPPPSKEAVFLEEPAHGMPVMAPVAGYPDGEAEQVGAVASQWSPPSTGAPVMAPVAGYPDGEAEQVGAVASQWPPPSTPRSARPAHRAWWALAVAGSVGVLLISIMFVTKPRATPVHSPSKSTAGSSGRMEQTQRRATSSPVQQIADQSSMTGPGFARHVPVGVYAGEADPYGVTLFGLATDTAPSFATDYLDKAGGWASMDSASNVKAWSQTPFRLVLGVPILPGVGTLAAGATGAYDQYFKVLGENLVNDNEADAILRLGWEFNGNWFPWSVKTAQDAADFTAFWRQIVTTMRSVPGEKFTFLWNPNAPSPTSYTAAQAYPGNAYVDYVGTDVYDNFWGTPFTPAVSWVHQLNQQWGLDWLAAFAAEHNKPIAIPEWSDEYRTDGHGLGDDPSFIDDMATWMVSNKVVFAGVWCYDSSATYRNNLLDGTFPKALAEFKSDFG
jgi:hypothetical protein